MAFRKRYQNFRKFGARSSARYFYKRAGGARGIAGVSLPYVAGAAAGYLAPRIHPMQDIAITALAVLPIRLPRYVGPVAKGYVLGMMARSVLPNIGGIGASTGGGDFA